MTNQESTTAECAVLQHIGASVKQLSPYQPGRPITEVARERGITNIVKLASNENPLGCGDAAHAALTAAGKDDLRLYPDANGFALRQALASSLNVSLESLILGNGSNDILELAAQLFLHANTAAVYAQHAFIVYSLATHARLATPRVVPAKDFQHDLAALAAATQEPNVRIVFIANPNNPTGTWHPPAAIKEFLAAARRDVLVVLDEAYCEYLSNDYGGCNATLPLLQQFPNLLITRTFSKIHGLAGLRIGYGIGHPALVEMMNRVRQPFNVNALAQKAAIAALADNNHIARSQATNREGYRAITAALTELNIPFIPSYANFVTFKNKDSDAAAALYEQLLQNGIICRALKEYEMPAWLRITIGMAADNERFVATLREHYVRS